MIGTMASWHRPSKHLASIPTERQAERITAEASDAQQAATGDRITEPAETHESSRRHKSRRPSRAVLATTGLVVGALLLASFFPRSAVRRHDRWVGDEVVPQLRQAQAEASRHASGRVKPHIPNSLAAARHRFGIGAHSQPTYRTRERSAHIPPSVVVCPSHCERHSAMRFALAYAIHRAAQENSSTTFTFMPFARGHYLHSVVALEYSFSPRAGAGTARLVLRDRDEVLALNATPLTTLDKFEDTGLGRVLSAHADVDHVEWANMVPIRRRLLFVTPPAGTDARVGGLTRALAAPAELVSDGASWLKGAVVVIFAWPQWTQLGGMAAVFAFAVALATFLYTRGNHSGG
jgi:hypothetical protein